jgi:hypothetical protein
MNCTPGIGKRLLVNWMPSQMTSKTTELKNY